VTTTTTLLELSTLPEALRAALDASFDNDESRRRAVLAPWSLCGYQTIHGDRLREWRGGFWRASALRRESEIVSNEFFALRCKFFDDTSLSIFDPSLPFFETPLTQVEACVRSPHPKWMSDAEFWAFAYQSCDADVDAARVELEKHGPSIDAVLAQSEGRGADAARLGVLKRMTTIANAWRTGDIPGM
jgi:hypothetical protein